MSRPARSLHRVAVFCGSSSGRGETYREIARGFGALLARSGIGLVYGGGNVGLMGELADAALAAGGHVIGVIPGGLERKELAHRGIQDLRVVGSMHERKQAMCDLCDAFVALPGSLGTMDELFEALTWGQLGIHDKPVGLLDPTGYYAPLVALLDRFVEEGFLRAAHRGMLVVEADGEKLLERLRRHEPPATPKWLDAERA